LSLDWFRAGQRLGLVLQRHRGDLDGFYRAGLKDPYRNPGSIIVGPRGSFLFRGVQVEGRYQFQYELNRYAILHNDASNHRLQLRGQFAIPER
jgi:hypothetical protein